MLQSVVKLKLSNGELKTLTGVNVADMGMEFAGTIIATTVAGSLLMIPVGLVTALILGVAQGSIAGFWPTITIAALFSYLPVGWRAFRNMQASVRIKKHLAPLLEEVKNYNNLVAHIHTIDQLAEIGNPVQVQDRDTVLTGLKTMREQLVRALKTERILRDKPEFQSSEFSLDLTALYALEVEQQATEYHKILHDTLQIGESVQTELQKCLTQRHTQQV